MLIECKSNLLFLSMKKNSSIALKEEKLLTKAFFLQIYFGFNQKSIHKI